MRYRIIDPGMASTVYLVQMLVISDALPSTVVSTEVYKASPQTQWPPVVPSPRGISQEQMSCENIYRINEW